MNQILKTTTTKGIIQQNKAKHTKHSQNKTKQTYVVVKISHSFLYP